MRAVVAPSALRRNVSWSAASANTTLRGAAMWMRTETWVIAGRPYDLQERVATAPAEYDPGPMRTALAHASQAISHFAIVLDGQPRVRVRRRRQTSAEWTSAPTQESMTMATLHRI